MNKSGILVFGILSILIVVAISGCTSNTKTYSGNGLSFQYPNNWKVSMNGSFPSNTVINSQVGLNTEQMDLFTVIVFNANSQGLEYYINHTRNIFVKSGSTIISEKPVQIAQVDGYRIDTISSQGIQQVFFLFVKNDKYYDLTFTTKSINSINNDINTIINSFQTT